MSTHAISLEFGSKASGRPTGRVLERLSGRHFPRKTEASAQGRVKCRQCVVCSKASTQPEVGRKRPGRQTA